MTATHPIRFSPEPRIAFPPPRRAPAPGGRRRRALRPRRAAAAIRRTPPSTRSSPWAWSCRARAEAAVDGAADRGRGGRARPAARRRHLAVRPDGRRGPGDRREQAPEPGDRGGRRGAPRGRGARGRARRPQRAAAPARALVSRRRLDGGPGDPRRHDRQQFVRVALDRLRLHGPPRRAPSTRAGGWHARAIRPGGGDRAPGDPRDLGARSRTLGAREGRDRGAVPQGVAARGGLQPRLPRARRARTSPSSSWAARAPWRGSSA